MILKSDVEMKVIAPAGFLILHAIKQVEAIMKTEIMITSGTEGQHSGPYDPHYTGEAYDVRSNNMIPEQKQQFLEELMKILGTNMFFAFLEDPGGTNEHFHIQRRKGLVFSFKDLLGLI